MEIKDYLTKYGRDEYRLMKWLKGYGINLLIAMNILKQYAEEDRIFETGSELDKVLLSESLKTEIDPFKEFINAKEEMFKAKDHISTVANDLMTLQSDFQKWWLETKKQVKEPWYRRVWKWITGQ